MRAAVLLSVLALCGCAAGTDAIVQTVRTAAGGDAGADRARLNPNFRYLRVTIEGRVALLALGDVDEHPQGPIEVWYSAEREVLRFQNGRLVGATGLTTEWRNVLLPELPAWSALARSEAPVHWVRTRDVMPGYRYGVRDALALRVSPQPGRSALRDVDPQRLTWFEERIEPAALPDAALPPARYAVQFAKPDHPGAQGAPPLLGEEGKGVVVYGEQCLAPKVCFTWQRWPAGS